MIKNLQYLFLNAIMILAPLGLVGQITVTNATFPVVGDTLSVKISSIIGDFDRNQVGENQTWDLTDAGTGVFNSVIYVDPMEGDSSALFPDADLLDISVGQEIYYKSFNNKIVEIGRSGLDPVLGLVNLNLIIEGEAVFRIAPMSYNDVFDDSFSFSFSESGDVIPDSLLTDQLEAILDSVRLTVETTHDDFVDGWGTLQLPQQSYEVLRMKRTNTINATLEAKLQVFGWVTVDPTNILFSGLDPNFLDLLGENITTNYQFFGADSKEIIADIATNRDDELAFITYKEELITATNDISANTPAIKTYPNPTFGDVTFDVQDLPSDDYSVIVYNIIGKELWSGEIDRHDRILSVDLSQLRKGTYIYSILDGEGRKVSTRRLIMYSY